MFFGSKTGCMFFEPFFCLLKNEGKKADLTEKMRIKIQLC